MYGMQVWCGYVLSVITMKFLTIKTTFVKVGMKWYVWTCITSYNIQGIFIRNIEYNELRWQGNFKYAYST